MKPTRPIIQVLPVLAALALVQPAVAAVTITYTPLARLADSTGSEILNIGTLVQAYHFGNNPTNISVGGVAFTAGNSGTGVPYAASGLTGSSNGMKGWLSGQLGYSFTDAAYGELIDQAYVGGSPVMTIGGLSIGQEYRLQIILQETRGTPIIEGTTGDALVFGNTGIVSATWVATDDTLNVSWSGGASPHFSGYALHAIPEPGSLALGALGLFSLLRRRRDS